jgi:DNA (cytosine-5)-methyltransferase 1
MLPVISLFSGAMGLDIGLERAGVTASVVVEIDDHCCATMKRNRPSIDVWQADVRELDAAALRSRIGNPKDVFLMVGGPPCQSFCPGGKRAALSDPRGNLIYTYLRLIQGVRPQFFVLENVANLVTASLRHRPIAERPGKHWNLSTYETRKVERTDDAPPMEPDEMSGSAIRQIASDIADMGYAIRLAVVNAADFGAPQNRLRLLILGARDRQSIRLPESTHGTNADDLLPYATVRDAIYDLAASPGAHSEYTPGVARYFQMVPPGGNWRSLPEQIQRIAMGEASFNAGGGKTGFFRRLHWDTPAPTITGRSNRKGSAMCHPEATRPISVRECARLQGFPDDWEFTGAMNQQYMQVGNAVPVHLGEAIGRAILREHNATDQSDAPLVDIDLEVMAAIQRLRASARNKRGTNISQTLLF